LLPKETLNGEGRGGLNVFQERMRVKRQFSELTSEQEFPESAYMNGIIATVT
jgi:hypothetical protein